MAPVAFGWDICFIAAMPGGKAPDCLQFVVETQATAVRPYLEWRDSKPHEATARVQFSAALIELFLFHDNLFREKNPKVWH